MWTKANILKLLRLVVVLLPLMFVLTSCVKEGANQTQEMTDEELADSHSGCWQDKILTSIYNAMGTMSMGLYKDITKGALALEMVGFALWFALRIMKFVSAITPENTGEAWNEIFKKLFLCWIISSIIDTKIE